MENTLWNEETFENSYNNDFQLYQNHILDQYKLYVEMTDRISSRRNLANVFFLTLNSIGLSLLGIFIENPISIKPKWLIFFPLISVLVLCAVWWWLIRSYRNLNSAKYKVIGQLEQKLPSSPYWKAEWIELGAGKNIRKYLPLTFIESFVPLIFSFLYVLLTCLYVFN